jgi:hypothetical protein
MADNDGDAIEVSLGEGTHEVITRPNIRINGYTLIIELFIVLKRKYESEKYQKTAKSTIF